MGIVEEMREAGKLLKQYKAKALEVANKIAEAINEVLPFKVEVFLGDGGVETWNFTCEDERRIKWIGLDPLTNYEPLWLILFDVFLEYREYGIHIESDIWVTPEEKNKIIERLRKLESGDNEEANYDQEDNR